MEGWTVELLWHGPRPEAHLEMDTRLNVQAKVSFQAEVCSTSVSRLGFGGIVKDGRDYGYNFGRNISFSGGGGSVLARFVCTLSVLEGYTVTT